MTAEEMWRDHLGYLTQTKGVYSAWAFGGRDDAESDLLAQLAERGVKQATTSALNEYGPDERLPQAGDYSVILDSRGQAVCIIVDESVTIRRFGDVDESYAFREGEGDKSLRYWRSVHQEAFCGITDDDLVVCEEFRKVYP